MVACQGFCKVLWQCTLLPLAKVLVLVLVLVMVMVLTASSVVW
jgi:hypothetical protein